MKLFYKLILSVLIFLIGSFTITAQNFNITLRSQLKYPNQTCGNIWGYVDSLSNEYALVTLDTGLSIVNVTNPDGPFEVKFIPGATSFWHEVEVWGKYAYVTHETTKGGVQIIDLSKLPSANIPSKFWKPIFKNTTDTITFETFHSLHIAKGYLYLYGGVPGGVLLSNLADPWNPVVEGFNKQYYVHDGYVRNDTIYAANIYDGFFSVIDATNKSTPTILQTQETPGKFTHNTWLSGDGTTLFTTDENSCRSALTSFDVSDINNITQLDIIYSDSNAVVHNCHVKNDWVICSWYKDGVGIVDGHRPGNMVKVGQYDMYPALSGCGYEGAWGVYPFLPSGNLLVSSISSDYGLFVLTPTYIRASYLEGEVSDSVTNNFLSGVKVEILTTSISDKTQLVGTYAIGSANQGIYSVRFSKSGYKSKVVNNVSLNSGIIKTLNVKLFPLPIFSVSIHVSDQFGNPVDSVRVRLHSYDYNYDSITDISGNTILTNVYLDTAYVLTIGKWGFITYCSLQPVNSITSTINVTLYKGIYDDFTFDFNWNSTWTGYKSQRWERGIPKRGNSLNAPDSDVANDCYMNAFVTGNYDESTGMNYPVNSGKKTLTSPVFDIQSSVNPFISFYYWYNNDATIDGPDTLFVNLSDGIGTTTTIYKIVQKKADWVYKQFRVSDFVIPTSTMQIMFIAKPYSNDNFEAGVDLFTIANGPAGIQDKGGLSNEEVIIKVYPNPFSSSVNIELNGMENSKPVNLFIRDITGRVMEEIGINKNLGKMTVGENLSPGIYLMDYPNCKKPVKVIKVI